MKKAFLWVCAVAVSAMAFSMNEKTNDMQEKRAAVKLETTAGDITIELYNETPGHRDNFLKNVREKAYDGVLFHRVINEFMIQTGDPASKTATPGQMLGSSDHGSEIPGEFVFPKYFHKKGAIAAARTGDNVNPEKKSSGSQFYIVTGKKYNEQELLAMERTQQNRQKQSLFDKLAGAHRREIMDLRRMRDTVGLQALQEKLVKQTEDSLRNSLFKFTQEQRETYVSIGGTPFLDGSYSVYGEVVAGMDVVDKIQQVATDGNDRPVEDVRILKATVLE